MNRLFLAGILLGSLLAFTNASVSMRGDDPDIQGKITQISRATAQEERRMIGNVMVEADMKDAKVDKANLIITGKTRIFKKQGEELVQATFEDLKVEQTVKARFVEGPTIMIYPLRVEVSEVVILKSE
jgi:hypothetical protein